MGISQLLTYGVLTAAAVLASPYSSHVTHEKREVNSPWIKRDRIAAGDILPMRIGLTQRNLDQGHERLMEISDPSSPNFGKHLSQKEVAEMFAPSKRTVDSVKDWLSKAGISKDRVQQSRDGGWLKFRATIAEAENLLQTQYHEYEHGIEGRSTVGCDEYKVPNHIQDHIDFIYPGTALQPGSGIETTKLGRRSRPQKRDDSPPSNSSCADLVTPECLRKLYNIPVATKAAQGNALGLFEKGSWYSPLALDEFFKTYQTRIPVGTRPANESVDLSAWHYDELNPIEADMDVQIAFSLLYPQNLTVIQVDDDYYNGFGQENSLGLFNTFLDAIDSSYCDFSSDGETGDDPSVDPVYPDHNTSPGIPPGTPTGPGFYKGDRACGTIDRPNVISLSYGWTEGTLPANYQYRQCKEFMKLSLMGTTVVAASGNTGTSGAVLCTIAGFDYAQTAAQYPSNCPYVLSVGATMLNSDFTESGANQGFWSTSGGFSYNFSRPAYQEAAVSEYNLKYNNLPEGTYNPSGRAFPDVSAIGANFSMIAGPILQHDMGSGTSASTPIVASIINLINEERLAAGKSLVGFVNPTFYANPDMFNDVVTGNNSMCTAQIYNATKGWDPVSGLGTPNYEKMLEVFMALP